MLLRDQLPAMALGHYKPPPPPPKQSKLWVLRVGAGGATPQQHPIAPPAHFAQHPELRLILRHLYPHP